MQHFLEEKFISCEPLVLDLLDRIGDLGLRESILSTKDHVKEFQMRIKALVNEDNSICVEECLKPLVQAIEFLANSLDATSLEKVKGALVEVNNDFTVDDRSWFHIACALGKVKAVKAFTLHFDCDPSKVKADYRERTPLIVAAASGHYNVVCLLLENGADPTIDDQDKMTPLKIAEEGEYETVVSLLKYALKPLLDHKYVRLELFVRDLIDLVGSLGVVPRILSRDQQELLDKLKAGENAIEEVAGEVPDTDFVIKCIEPLIQAIKDLANLEVGAIPENVDNLAKSLTYSQNNFTRNRWSWFYVACAHGNAGSVKTMILSCGCSAQSTITDENGYTPLIAAAKEGHIEIVALLVRYGATVDKEIPVSCVDKVKEPTMYSLLNALKASSSINDDDTAPQVKNEERLLPKGSIIKTKHESGVNTECVVIKHLGRGTFGHVYKVFHIKKLCFEAVKVVRFVRWNGSAWIPLLDEERIERLRSATDEVEKMLALGKAGLHPNLVALRDIHLLRNVCPEQGDAYDDNLYIFMDYVEKGMTLDDFVKEEELPLKIILKLMLDVARGLLFITEKEHTHKDIKPANILVDATTLLAKISDFGSGYTPAFSSPETARGQEDPTQHQWTWATTALAALTGGGCSWENWFQAVRFLSKQEPKDKLHCIALELCRSCMQLNSETRCSMEDVVKRLEDSLSMESLFGDFQKCDEMETWHIYTEMGRILQLELTQKQSDYERAKQYFITAKDTAVQLEGEESPIFASSLNNLAGLLSAQGKYDEAKPHYERTLEIFEQVHGLDHPHVAATLNNLAELLENQSNYNEAKSQYERSLRIREQILGSGHPDVAQSLNNLAGLLEAAGNHDDAKPLYQRAIEIWEKVHGLNHPLVATGLNNLAGLLSDQGKYDGAKSLYERSLNIREQVLGLNHPDVAGSLNNLARLLENQSEYDEAKPLYKRSLVIEEKVYGPDHPEVATGLDNLAGLLRIQGNYEEAKAHCERSLKIREELYGADHPDVATSLSNLALLLKAQGEYDEAMRLCKRALEIQEQVYGLHHPERATSLNNLAGLLKIQGEYEKARARYESALKIDENIYGPDHPEVATDLNNLAGLLRAQCKYEEAKPLYERSLNIRKQVHGSNHISVDVAQSLNNLAGLLKDQGKYDEAKPLYERAMEIWETIHGHNHPEVATGLNNLAVLLSDQGKYGEAKPLFERSLNIREEVHGRNHPDVAQSRYNLATLSKDQGNYDEAIKLYKDSLEIDEKIFGFDC